MDKPDHDPPPANSTAAVTDELIRALQDPSLYPHAVKHFSVIETHISWVILTGDYAYKIKKPVNLGFVDFSTLARREHFCNEELRLNRRFAAELYLDVVAIRGTRTQPCLAGDGAVIEYALKMREFTQSSLLNSYASEQRLLPAHIDAMADVIADFHERAQHADDDTAFGCCDTFLKWSRENFRHIEAVLPGHVLPGGFEALKKWCLSLCDTHQDRMNERLANGFVRECHGDLHLGNMALIDGQITLFDCIEFNAELRWIDTASEIAFLAMDLQAHGYPGYCWRFINRYLQACGDYSSVALLRHYLVYRALVRAKVEALRVQPPDSAAPNKPASYRDVSVYLDLATAWSTDTRPALLIMHGFSGSGKSTCARQLVEALGAIQVRSDVERKRLFDLDPYATSASATGQGIYTVDASEQTYDRLAELARTILQAGYTTIVDASFLKASQRDQFTRLASQYEVPHMFITCGAAESVLRERIRQRAAHGTDPSEATLDVLQQQIQSHDPLTEEEQAHALAPDPSRALLAPEQLEVLKQRIAVHQTG